MTKQNQTQPSHNFLKRLAEWFNQPGPDVDAIILVLLSVVTIIVFANALNGAFVYDDEPQIVNNPVVRDSEQFWSAFSTDVWAFKTGGAETVSDYWRPFFILWLVLNERLFGLANTTGWHLTNLLLHIGTAVLAYFLLRKIKISRPITTAIILLFLIHPTRVESVTWISGSPDLLMALPILGACLLLLNHKESADLKQYIAALLLFTIALLAKEAAILFPILVFLFYLLWSTEDTKLNLNRLVAAGRYTLPFLIVAALYIAARVAVLDQLFSTNPWQQPIGHVLLTLPSVITFYLRQSLFPLTIGPTYPLRVLSPAELNLQNFWLPLLITLITLALLGWYARRSAIRQFGLALFFLFLLPAFNINAFHPEQIVHDRYLYLPLLGLLIIVVPALKDGLQQLSNQLFPKDWPAVRFGVLTLLVTAVLTLPLALQTIRYNTAWQSNVALWERGVQTDPTSILGRYLYGYFLFRDGRLQEAETAMNTVINNQPLTGPYYTYLQAVSARLERADIAASQGRIEAAREDLNLIINLSPDTIIEENRANLDAQQQRAVERLALSYIQENDYDSAIEVLENGRQQLPQLSCTLTTNLAVSLYLTGRKQRALRELESVQERVELEYTPLCKMSLFYLGQLYMELGRTADARAALQDFLAASQPFYNPQITNLQEQSRQLLNQLSAQ